MTPREFALDIVRRLRSAGFQALWAGGCVRDQLLGHEPHDYDVATDARPEQVQALFRRTVAVGLSFGVVEVLGPKPLRVQVATFRSDGDYSDGRRPTSVTYSTPEADARRRDFTINGVFYDPIAERVIDYVGGERDLNARVVRAIGDPVQRFTEDKLRLIRAVRFAARFEFEIDPATAAAIRTMAHQIVVVAAERIADELRKILTDRHRARAVRLLAELELLTPIVPEVAHDPFVLESALNRLAHLGEPVTFPLALGALLADAGPEAPRRVADHLRLSNAEAERAIWLVTHRASLIGADRLPLCRLKPILAHSGINELLALLRTEAERLTDAEFCERCLRDWPAERINPPPLVTGEDVRALGLPPGPRFKSLLDAVRQAQLDEEISTRDQALTRLAELTSR